MKQALCIERAVLDLPTTGDKGLIINIEGGIEQIPVKLVPREQCEHDESLLQLIPYIVLVNSEGQFLAYRRGAASGEDRLKAKISIGWGGHVEELPADGESLLQLLKRDGEREVLEEIGLTVDLPSHCALMYTPADAVGRVHLGLLTVCLIDDDKPLVAEEGAIDLIGWVSRDELTSPEIFDQLEDWSKTAARFLLSGADAKTVGKSFSDVLDAAGELFQLMSIVSAPTGISSAVMQEMAVAAVGLGVNLMHGHIEAKIHQRAEALYVMRDLLGAITQLARALDIPLDLLVARENELIARQQGLQFEQQAEQPA
jgi:predicted NUDIX family phosphoesterase